MRLRFGPAKDEKYEEALKRLAELVDAHGENEKLMPKDETAIVVTAVMVQKQQALEGDSVAAPRGEAQPQQAPDQQTPQLPLPNTQRKRRRLTACKDGAGGLDDAAAIDDAVDALPEASEDCEVVPETMRKVRKLSGLQQVQVETKITGFIKQCPIKFIALGNQGFASRVNSGQMRTLAKQMEINFSVCQMHFPELDSSLSKAHEVSCTVCWGFRQTMLPDIELPEAP